MARREPFHKIAIAQRIYEALDRRRLAEFKDEFRPKPMNTYCEEVLWDFAQGKLIRAGSARSVLELGSGEVSRTVGSTRPPGGTGQQGQQNRKTK